MSTSHRYTLTIPDNLHTELTAIAENEGVSLKELITRFIKIGMVTREVTQDPTKQLILRCTATDQTKETQLVFV